MQSVSVCLSGAELSRREWQDSGFSLGTPVKERLHEEGTGPLSVQDSLYSCPCHLEEGDSMSSLGNTRTFPVMREQTLWGD